MYFAGLHHSHRWNSTRSEPGITEITRYKFSKLQHTFRGMTITMLLVTAQHTTVFSKYFPCFYQDTSNEEDRAISFPVPGASDCLHSSEECVQFQIKKAEDKERWSKSKEFFATLPLDTDTSESNSVYTSDKLNFL